MRRISATWALDEMPEAFVPDTSISRAVSRAVKAGKLRKLASRLHTRNTTDPPEAVVARNLWNIAAGYFPNGLIADRTALWNVPARCGATRLRPAVHGATLLEFDGARLSGEHAPVARAAGASGEVSTAVRSRNGWTP